MKRAFLFHGTGGSDIDYYWFADTKNYLENHGYSVWWPLLPNTDTPSLAESKQFIHENMPEVSEDTIMIGHSSACPFILNILESLPVTIRQVLLVSGYYQPISDESVSMLPSNGFNWDTIKQNAQEIIFINSDNDPWGCTDVQARSAAEALGSPLIVAFGQGHMGSSTYNQPMHELPLLKRMLL